MNTTNTKPTVVLVHGAWADGSSWMKLIALLQARGVATMAAPIPLTSLSDERPVARPGPGANQWTPCPRGTCLCGRGDRLDPERSRTLTSVHIGPGT